MNPESAPTIFLTARFRSGSTLLWNLFNHCPGSRAYYEPLHEQLPLMIERDIAPQAKHFHVESYFGAYPPLDELRQRHSLEFGAHRLLLEAGDEHQRLRAYLDYLRAHGSQKSPETPAVFQFNRADFRLPWLRANFPSAKILHMVRSPRDQWMSMIEGMEREADADKNIDPYRIAAWSRDLCRWFPFLDETQIDHSYQRHYYLWKLSWLMGRRNSDWSFSYEELLAAPQEMIAKLLSYANVTDADVLATCQSLVVQRPLNTWHGYRDEAWFSSLEDRCEETLEEFGLNERFGKMPLPEIIQQSAAYQKALGNDQRFDWAIRDAQAAIVKQYDELDRKQILIDHFNATQEERLRLIQELHESNEKKQIAINCLQKQLNYVKTFGLYLLYDLLRRFFLPKLGRLSIHKPRPLFVPKRYYAKPKLTEHPTISIVTPSYNQAGFLEKTMRSVLDQGYPALEYVVQDGLSTDGSIGVIERFQSQLHHWESVQDHGQAHAINLGFQHTGGEIMAWLNSDDVLLPGALHYVAGYFQSHPEADAIYGHRVLIDVDGNETGRWVLPPHDAEVLRWADFVPQETLFWRRSIWEKAGGCVQEEFQFALDWDLLLRFEEAGATIVRAPRFIGAFRIHPQQKTSANIASVGNREMDQLRCRLHGRSVGEKEIYQNVRAYLLKHAILQHLYQWGMIRY